MVMATYVFPEDFKVYQEKGWLPRNNTLQMSVRSLSLQVLQVQLNEFEDYRVSVSWLVHRCKVPFRHLVPIEVYTTTTGSWPDAPLPVTKQIHFGQELHEKTRVIVVMVEEEPGQDATAG